MEQGKELLPEMSCSGVWEPKGLIFKLFWFETCTLEDFAMVHYSKYFISNWVKVGFRNSSFICKS